MEKLCFLACSAWFPIWCRTIWPRVALPPGLSLSTINQENALKDLPTGQTDGNNFLIDVPIFNFWVESFILFFHLIQSQAIVMFVNTEHRISNKTCLAFANSVFAYSGFCNAVHRSFRAYLFTQCISLDAYTVDWTTTKYHVIYCCVISPDLIKKYWESVKVWQQIQFFF